MTLILTLISLQDQILNDEIKELHRQVYWRFALFLQSSNHKSIRPFSAGSEKLLFGMLQGKQIHEENEQLYKKLDIIQKQNEELRKKVSVQELYQI